MSFSRVLMKVTPAESGAKMLIGAVDVPAEALGQMLAAAVTSFNAAAVSGVLSVFSRRHAPALLGRGRATPRYSLSESLAADKHLVCAFIDGMPSMSAEQWAALLAERQRVGRCLCDSEARAVLEAVGGHDVHD